MDNLLDLSGLDTKRYFIVGEARGDHHAVQRLLFQQRYTWADTLIFTGNFLNLENQKCMELIKFLHNVMNGYSVMGESEARFIRDIDDIEKSVELKKTMGKDYNDTLIDYIKDLPLVIKINNFYIMNAGVDPSKPLDDQDQEVFYSIGDYDKDSRFYQYSNPDGKPWYNTPFLVNGTHVKICFSKVYSDTVEVPAGYNLSRKEEIGTPLRCIIINKASNAVDIITSA